MEKKTYTPEELHEKQDGNTKTGVIVAFGAAILAGLIWGPLVGVFVLVVVLVGWNLLTG